MYFLSVYTQLMYISIKAYAFLSYKNINYKLSSNAYFEEKNLINLKKQLII